MRDVVRQLSPDEANLNQAAAALGPDAMPHLEALVRGPDPMLASKAVYAAGQMRHPRTMQVLQIAAARADRMVRLAVATTVPSLPPDQAAAILAILLIDPDPECRRIAIETVPRNVVPHIRDVLEMLELTDPYPFIRELSAEILVRWSDSDPHDDTRRK